MSVANVKNIFDRRYGCTSDIVAYFKEISKYKYENFDTLIKYLEPGGAYSSTIIISVLKYSMSLPEGPHIRLNNESIRYILAYADCSLTGTFILCSDGHIDYKYVYDSMIGAEKYKLAYMIFDKVDLTESVIHQIYFKIAIGLPSATDLIDACILRGFTLTGELVDDLIAKKRYEVIYHIFNRVKLTYEQVDKLFSKVTSPIAEKLLGRSIFIGMPPHEDQIFSLISRGVNVSSDILSMYHITSDDIRYTISRIRSGKIDFKKEKGKIYTYNDLERQQIKVAIFESLQYYTDLNLEMISTMFNIKYDEECMRAFCEQSISTDHKIFWYMVGIGIEPNFKMTCNLISRINSISKIHKFFKAQ